MDHKALYAEKLAVIEGIKRYVAVMRWDKRMKVMANIRLGARDRTASSGTPIRRSPAAKRSGPSGLALRKDTWKGSPRLRANDGSSPAVP